MLRLQKTTKKFCQIKKNDYLCTRKQGNIVGALDEWLSQRSAKPSTAVRIRQAPQRKVLKPQNGFQDFFSSSQLSTKKKNRRSDTYDFHMNNLTTTQARTPAARAWS